MEQKRAIGTAMGAIGNGAIIEWKEKNKEVVAVREW